MTVRWTVVVAALCAARAAALPASSAAPDPWVVTRDGAERSGFAGADATATVTRAPPPALKVTEMEVRSEVSMRYARTAVVTRVRNPADQSQEAVFRVLIPETAYISGFQMTLDGKTYKAYVKGKEEAKHIYDQAVSQGASAAHVAVKARDSNEFMVNINLGENSEGTFNLTYEELLVRRNGVYNHDINLLPGGPVPKLTVVVRVREAQPITVLRVPEVRTGNEIDATDADASNSIAVIERSADNREATITFKPDLEEQKRLMQVYAEKSRESQQSTRRYSSEKTEPKGVLGQFVVQYDVDRPKNGEILVNDGYFVHFFAPESLPPLTKLVVFVLDTSGSMSDRKIVQLREAMQAILSELNPGDYFSIVEFSSAVKVHDLKEADEPVVKPPNVYSYYSNWYNENKPVTLLPPFSATKENIDKAKVIVNRLFASGGTNIASALEVAINIVRKGVATGATGATANTGASANTGVSGNTGTPENTGATGETDEPTEGPTTEASAVAATTEEYNGDDEETQQLKSIIVFLTDGEPTVGEIDPKRIINRVSEKNSGPRRATIFSLAFGEDADRSFLRKLSLRNDGFMRHIYEAADAALQLRDFYRQISSPLLDDVTFVYPPNQVAAGSLTKHKFRTYYAGGEVVVAGRVAADAAELAPRLVAWCGVLDGVGKIPYEVFPKVPVARNRSEFLPLERLWVSLTIRQLLDRRDSADAAPADDSETRAKDLALKYSLVTPLTSLVVVKPNATDAVDTQSVDETSRPVFSGQLAAHGLSNLHSAYSSMHSSAHYSTSNIAALPVADYAESADYNDYVDTGMSSMPARVAYKSRRRFRPQYYASGRTGAAGHMAFSAIRPYHYGSPGHAELLRPQYAPAPPPSAADQSMPALSPLRRYHLEHYGWTQSLLDTNSDALVLQVNGTSVNLKLTKDNNAPVDASDAACGRSTDGGSGVCVYLTRCQAARFITDQLYTDIYCAVQAANQGYAGVCCPSASVVAPSSAAAPTPASPTPASPAPASPTPALPTPASPTPASP